MTEHARREFDCIRFVREVRVEIARETAGMSLEERVRYYRTYPYSNPVLERLANPACATNRHDTGVEAAVKLPTSNRVAGENRDETI